MATMADVARLAGVSSSTVSYALTGARPISKATRERIEQAMLELEYTPNVFARGLKSKRSRIIALLFPRRHSELGLSAMEYILGASDHAQDRGYHLLLWTTEADALGDLAQLAGQGLVDGVLIMEVDLDDARIEVVRGAGLTFATIGRTADTAGIDYTDTDFGQCAALAVEHLLELGHRRLGFVNLGPIALRTGRGNAVRMGEGMLAATADGRAELVRTDAESSVDGGREAFHELLRQDPDLTAVIVFNEQATAGIMASAIGSGRRIPDELSLVSIDMPAHAAQLTVPSLTTVSPSAAAMGRTAVDFLIRRLEGDPAPHGQVLFPGELHLRGSTGPPGVSHPVPFRVSGTGTEADPGAI